MLLRYAKIKIWSFVIDVCWWWSFMGTKTWDIRVLGGGSCPPGSKQNKAEATLFQVRLSRRNTAAAGSPPHPPSPPPPREKQLSPSENLQCGDISSSVTETTLITAQKSDTNAAFVGGKASPAHLLSWRVEAGGGGGWAVRGRCDTRTQTDHTAHPRKELMIHLDLEEAASSRQWRRENGNADTLKSVFTRLQTASNEGKQPQRVHPGWDGGLWRMLMSAQDTFLLPSISPMSYLIRPGSLQQTN